MDKAKQFIIWLDGFLDGRETINEKQTLTIKNKLDSIFDHEAMDSVVSKEVPHKPTLTELGKKHGFDVQVDTIHGKQNGDDETLYRC